MSRPGPRRPTRPTSSGTPVPGIETTLPDHIPPNAFVYFPEPSGIGTGTVAQVADPAAPRITVAVPDGWNAQPGEGDVALALSGPDDMTGTVTIAATTLGPTAAFADYAATLRRSKPGLQMDTAGAKFCGYSSQKLTSTFPGPPGTLELPIASPTSGPTQTSTWSPSTWKDRRAHPDSVRRKPP